MEEIIKKLQKLVKTPGFFYTYNFAIRGNLMLPEWHILKVNPRAHLNFWELWYVWWLLATKEIDTSIIPTTEEIEKQAKELTKYLAELHWNFWEIAMSESIFYGDSWVYDFQYIDFIKHLYRNDANRLKEKKDIDFSWIWPFWEWLSGELYNRINNKKLKKDLLDVALDTYAALSFKEEEIPNDFLQFFRAFSFVPGEENVDYRHPMWFNKLEAYPIIRLNGIYYIPISFFLTKALYTTPHYRILEDKKYYNSKWASHRWNATEDMCLMLTEPIVWSDSSFKNVIIRDESGKDIGEIDVLLVIGNRAIIIQAKAKKLTEAAKRWDREKYMDDFQKAIQEAYDQWIVCREFLLDWKNTLWVNEKQIKLKNDITDAYILCVTLDYYPSVILNTKLFLEKKQNQDPRPLSISIFDLQIITDYLRDKFNLLFYIHQRIKYWEKILSESEISILWYHLSDKLYLWEEYTMCMIDNDFWALVDVNYPAKKWHWKKTKEFYELHSKWKNERFDQIIQHIETSGSPEFTDAILFLYGLSNDSIDDIFSNIDKFKQKAEQDGRTHDFSLLFDEVKMWITIKTYPIWFSQEEMIKSVMLHTQARKYKSKGDLWLWFWFYANSDSDDWVVFIEKSQWSYDKDLESFTNSYLSKTPTIVDSKLNPIRRKWPCPCGSGKKYKRCCWT